MLPYLSYTNSEPTVIASKVALTYCWLYLSYTNSELTVIANKVALTYCWLYLSYNNSEPTVIANKVVSHTDAFMYNISMVNRLSFNTK